MMRRRNLIITGVVLILAVLGYFGYTGVYVPATAPTPTPETADEFEEVIWASGEVIPKTWAELSFPIGGQVVELNVSEGDEVTEGAVLARLESADLEDAVEAAEAAVSVAKAELARLKAGPRPSEIAQAEQAVLSAKAGRDAAGAELQEAQAELDGAQAALDRLLAGARAEDVDSGAANLLKAEAALKKAQAEYDKISWAKDVSETPQAIALETATLDYNIAKAAYEKLLNGATAEEVAETRAGVSAAEAAVSAAKAAISQAEAEVGAAEAALELLREGATAEEIAVAEATVKEVEAELAGAKTELEKAVLVAPFDGTVGEIYVHLGEQVQTALNDKVLVIGDISNMRVETTDLRETDVGRIEVGQEVDITFDALPDTVLKGHVVHISPKARSEQGGVNYRTVIEFDEIDPTIRWGMTAYVNITVK